MRTLGTLTMMLLLMTSCATQQKTVAPSAPPAAPAQLPPAMTRDAGPVPARPVLRAEVPPTCVQQATGTPRQATLSWSYTQGALPQYGQATGFDVERASLAEAQAGSYTLLARLPISTLTYTDANVAAGTAYYYRTRATNATGTSDPSNVVCKAMLADAPQPPQPTGTLNITLLSKPGTVESVPPGILCPSICTRDFAAGTRVTLVATPKPPNKIATWSGSGCTLDRGQCVVTIPTSAEVRVAVLFAKK